MQEIFRGKETRKKEKEENIRRSKNGEGKEENIWRQRIFFLRRRRITEKENIWGREISLEANEKEKKYLEREKRRRKRRKIFQELKKN